MFNRNFLFNKKLKQRSEPNCSDKPSKSEELLMQNIESLLDDTNMASMEFDDELHESDPNEFLSNSLFYKTDRSVQETEQKPQKQDQNVLNENNTKSTIHKSSPNEQKSKNKTLNGDKIGKRTKTVGSIKLAMPIPYSQRENAENKTNINPKMIQDTFTAKSIDENIPTKYQQKVFEPYVPLSKETNTTPSEIIRSDAYNFVSEKVLVQKSDKHSDSESAKTTEPSDKRVTQFTKQSSDTNGPSSGQIDGQRGTKTEKGNSLKNNKNRNEKEVLYSGNDSAIEKKQVKNGNIRSKTNILYPQKGTLKEESRNLNENGSLDQKSALLTTSPLQNEGTSHKEQKPTINLTSSDESMVSEKNIALSFIKHDPEKNKKEHRGSQKYLKEIEPSVLEELLVYQNETGINDRERISPDKYVGKNNHFGISALFPDLRFGKTDCHNKNLQSYPEKISYRPETCNKEVLHTGNYEKISNADKNTQSSKKEKNTHRNTLFEQNIGRIGTFDDKNMKSAGFHPMNPTDDAQNKENVKFNCYTRDSIYETNNINDYNKNGEYSESNQKSHTYNPRNGEFFRNDKQDTFHYKNRDLEYSKRKNIEPSFTIEDHFNRKDESSFYKLRQNDLAQDDFTQKNYKKEDSRQGGIFKADTDQEDLRQEDVLKEDTHQDISEKNPRADFLNTDLHDQNLLRTLNSHYKLINENKRKSIEIKQLKDYLKDKSLLQAEIKRALRTMCNDIMNNLRHGCINYLKGDINESLMKHSDRNLECMLTSSKLFFTEKLDLFSKKIEEKVKDGINVHLRDEFKQLTDSFIVVKNEIMKETLRDHCDKLMHALNTTQLEIKQIKQDNVYRSKKIEEKLENTHNTISCNINENKNQQQAWQTDFRSLFEHTVQTMGKRYDEKFENSRLISERDKICKCKIEEVKQSISVLKTEINSISNQIMYFNNIKDAEKEKDLENGQIQNDNQFIIRCLIERIRRKEKRNKKIKSKRGKSMKSEKFDISNDPKNDFSNEGSDSWSLFQN